MPITVTEKALQRLRDMLRQRGPQTKGLRVGVKGGGCTGFQYQFEFSDDDPRPQDHVFDFEGGIRVYCDPKSYLFLNGTELDYVESLMESGFKFQNPNVKSTCGCGSSVNF